MEEQKINLLIFLKILAASAKYTVKKILFSIIKLGFSLANIGPEIPPA